MVLLITAEERLPRFSIFADDLLGTGTAEDGFILAFETPGIGVPDAFITVEVLPASVVYLVPETSRSVQPLFEQLTLLWIWRAEANIKLVGSLHEYIVGNIRS